MRLLQKRWLWAEELFEMPCRALLFRRMSAYVTFFSLFASLWHQFCKIGNAWSIHKKACQPFSATNTVTLKPFYENRGVITPTSTFTRNALGIPTPPTPSSHHRSAHVPKGVSGSRSESKNLIIKVQVPYDMLKGGSAGGSCGDLLIYSKKRDFVCTVRRSDNSAAYDCISKVVRTKGVGGAKAYFAAELKSKDELVVKVSEVLAEQPF